MISGTVELVLERFCFRMLDVIELYYVRLLETHTHIDTCIHARIHVYLSMCIVVVVVVLLLLMRFEHFSE